MDQGYREIGPDGTITLFKDLLRRLGEAGHDFHIGDPEANDRGEIACRAVLFTARHRYDLMAVQPPADAKSSLSCFVSDRTASANPFPTPITGPQRNILSDAGYELTDETFRHVLRGIVANELVVLDTAGERALPRHDGDFAGEAMGPHGSGALGEVDIPANRLTHEEEKLLFSLMERGGVPRGLGSAVGDALRRAR